jgi:hypothetical protein
MRLYLFRSTASIDIKEMEKVAEKINRVFNYDYSIFPQPISGSVEKTTVEDLLQITDQFLVRGEPVTAIVFTREGIIDDEAILGQGSEQNRGAWVKWSDNIEQTTTTALHELGHICEAEHCSNESCIMFHTYREHKGSSMSDLLCDKCRATIQNSWVYGRLTHATEDRAKKGQTLPRIIQSNSPITSLLSRLKQPKHAPSPMTPTSAGKISPGFSTRPFPDWPPAETDNEEFFRRVIEHFDHRRNTR